MRETIFKSNADMPACEKILRPASDGLMPWSPMPECDNVRTMLSIEDRRVASTPAMMPNKAHAVHNLTPRKRGHHY